MKNRVINVKQLARVEGEGALYIKVQNGRVSDVKLNIFEPPRFFEAFLRGRKYSEAPDITARICGICPVAYQMSSVHAMEDALSVNVGGQLRDLRILLYCGEWIESHVLHIYMLHAPDFLGYEDAILLAKDHPDLVKRALRMKKAGNQIVALLGGREIHPINVRVGGFYRLPSKATMHGLLDELKWARDAAIETTTLIAGLEYPALDVPYEFVSLSHPTEYPMLGDRIVSSSGLDISVREYELSFQERHVSHSNALHSYQGAGQPYAVGPLARWNLEYRKLPDSIRSLAESAGAAPPVTNPFKSILIRSFETLYAFEKAIQIIEEYEPGPEAAVEIQPKAGTGFGASEAPRGLLYHRYRLGSDGIIKEAKIVPPTSQNQPTIENDLRIVVEKNLSKTKDDLTWICEQAVRNYDPCISCATHFLTLTIDETTADPPAVLRT